MTKEEDSKKKQVKEEPEVIEQDLEKKEDKVEGEELHPKAEKFSSKDKLTCIAIDALGHTPIKVERSTDAKASLFYFWPATAWEDWDKYRRGEPLSVLIRDYEDAEKRFRNNLYDTK